MLQRFLTTPPEMRAAASQTITFTVTTGLHLRNLRVESDFPVTVAINGASALVFPSVMCPRFRYRHKEGIATVTVTLPTGWSTQAQVAARHGWCLIECFNDDIEVPVLGPESGTFFHYNHHIQLTSGAGVDESTMALVAADFQKNGRLPDLCWLLGAAFYTHLRSDQTPTVHRVIRCSLIKFPANPAGIPEDNTIAFDVAFLDPSQGCTEFAPAGPMKFPLRSYFASYGGGDTTPNLLYDVWHAVNVPATTDLTASLSCVGIML